MKKEWVLLVVLLFMGVVAFLYLVPFISTTGKVVTPSIPLHISYHKLSPALDLKYAKYTATPVSRWNIDVIDSQGNTGLYTSIAVSPQGDPYISYYDATNADLKLAKKVGAGGNCGGGRFSCITIDEPPGSAGQADVGSYSSLAFLGNTPYISYYDIFSHNIKIAYEVGTGGNCGPQGSWQCDVIDTLTLTPLLDNNPYLSLAIIFQGVPYISYIKPKPGGVPGGDLRVAHKVGIFTGNCGPQNSWQCDLIKPLSNGKSTSITSYGSKPYVAYIEEDVDANAVALKIAYNVGVGVGGNCGPQNTWKCELIDADLYTNYNSNISLTVDPSTGIPYVSYYDPVNNDLKLAHRVGSGGNCGSFTGSGGQTSFGIWQCEAIDVAGNVGEYNSLVQESGNFYISYFDQTNLDLKLAYSVGSGGNCGSQGSWQCDAIDVDGFVGLYTSLSN
ncbi:MAG: hypothetical protein HY393_03285 [Candidatus Diapherotrites archaeon]|nr:hypothetical protein [Candidatus Diapherotrites archaeon]